MTPEGPYVVMVYAVYVPVSVGLTVWLARTLFQHGAVFLDDVFPERPEVAVAINRLLVTGFYMFNLGYAFLILRADPASSVVGAVEELATKLGLLLVSLAFLHFINVFVFQRIRQRATEHQALPPVAASASWGSPPAPEGASGSWPPPQ
ncbi:MAG: hypothetical protein GEU81_17895 [Nitriliruptorales bacterium]|nr:hypothetical protein [Nitriliruptorales bacterium]